MLPFSPVSHNNLIVMDHTYRYIFLSTSYSFRGDQHTSLHTLVHGSPTYFLTNGRTYKNHNEWSVI